MALILLRTKRLATFWDTERSKAMQHHNSVFHSLLKHVPWHRFDALVDEHRSDAGVRRLMTKSQFTALLYGQLSGTSGLRETITGLSSHALRLYHLGMKPVRRSTLSDANAKRPSAVFTGLLEAMMKQAHRGLRRKLAETTYLIDSTGVRLNEYSAEWARFSTGVCGAKTHVIYDADADRPIYAAVSAANVNDITIAKQMPIEPGATYVFDLGYYDYAWWADLDTIGCRIVTRFKSNTKLATIEELQVPAGSDILRPYRLAAPTAGLQPAKPYGACCARGHNQDPNRKNPAPPVERSRRQRLRDRRSVPPTLGHRAVLPLDQADAADHPLHRHQRECGPHPDRRRTDRLPAAPPRSSSPKSCREPAGLRQADPRQPYAPSFHR
jgi:uncharacterized protein DUF4372/DDE family transposase